MNSLKRLQCFFPPKAGYADAAPLSQSYHAASPRESSSSSFDACVESEPTNVNLTLNEEEIAQINLLIPRLCHLNHLKTATRLVLAALLANPPPKSLSFSVLIDSISSQPDMTQAMSFLTRLKLTPVSHPHIGPINTMLITSYFSKDKQKEAFKVYDWMVRPDSPCLPDEKLYGILICGFCRKGMVFEGLKVLRTMVDAKLIPKCVVKNWVCRGLLWEARVKEAAELEKTLSCIEGGGDESLKKALALLEDIISNWTD